VAEREIRRKILDKDVERVNCQQNIRIYGSRIRAKHNMNFDLGTKCERSAKILARPLISV
jgi:hypothetical protein